eukprot:804220-Rhodomonas_salina.1
MTSMSLSGFVAGRKLQRELRSTGYTCTTAPVGPAGAEAICYHRLLALLLDAINGITVTTELRTSTAR